MAISGQLIVSPEELRQQAQQVREAAKELQDNFSRMRSLVDGTESFWKGEAADAHRQGYVKNQSTIDEIIARYQEHVRDLEEMAGVYQEAETVATNMADELPALTL